MVIYSAPPHSDNGHPSRGNLVLNVTVPHLGNSCAPEDLCARQISVNQII